MGPGDITGEYVDLFDCQEEKFKRERENLRTPGSTKTALRLLITPGQP